MTPPNAQRRPEAGGGAGKVRPEGTTGTSVTVAQLLALVLEQADGLHWHASRPVGEVVVPLDDQTEVVMHATVRRRRRRLGVAS